MLAQSWGTLLNYNPNQGNLIAGATSTLVKIGARGRTVRHRPLPRPRRRRPAKRARPEGRECDRLRPAAPALRGCCSSCVLSFLTFFVFNEIPTSPACLVVACGPKTTTTDAMYPRSRAPARDRPPGADAVRRLVVARRPRRRLRHLVGRRRIRSARRLAHALPVTISVVARRNGADAPARRAAGRARRDASTHAGRPRHPRAQRHRARGPPVRPRQPDQPVLLRSPPCLLDLLSADRRRNAAARHRNHRPLRRPAVRWPARLGRPPRGAVARLRAPLSAALHADDPRPAARDPARAVHRHGPREGRDGGARARRPRDAQRVRTAPADARGRRGTAITAAIYVETVFGLQGLGALSVGALSAAPPAGTTCR